jgi:hypothetical protein
VDICGMDVWGAIVMEADLSFPEGTLVCAGIPLFRKNEAREFTDGLDKSE